MRLRFLALCVLPLLLCEGGGSSAFAADADSGKTGLADTRWTLVRLAVNGAEQPLGEAWITLHFAPGDKIDGRAAVNAYQGQCIADPAGNLRWPTPTRSTRMGGPAPLLRLESVYLSALAKTNRWQLYPGPELRLSAADGKTVLTFRSSPAP